MNRRTFFKIFSIKLRQLSVGRNSSFTIFLQQLVKTRGLTTVSR